MNRSSDSDRRLGGITAVQRGQVLDQEAGSDPTVDDLADPRSAASHTENTRTTSQPNAVTITRPTEGPFSIGTRRVHHHSTLTLLCLTQEFAGPALAVRRRGAGTVRYCQVNPVTCARPEVAGVLRVFCR